MKLAFIIVDIQQEYYDSESAQPFIKNAIKTINTVSKMVRKANMPVIHMQHYYAGNGPDTPGFEVAKKIIQDKSDYHFVKKYGNSFWKTPLKETLDQLNIDFVVISGFAAMKCVLATYNGALERNINATILQRGIADRSQANIDCVMKNTNGSSSVVIKELLES